MNFQPTGYRVRSANGTLEFRITLVFAPALWADPTKSTPCQWKLERIPTSGESRDGKGYQWETLAWVQPDATGWVPSAKVDDETYSRVLIDGGEAELRDIIKRKGNLIASA